MRSRLVCHPVIGLKKDSGSGAETSAGRSLTTIQSNLGTESVHARQRPTGSRGSGSEQPENRRMKRVWKRKEESIGVEGGGRDKAVILTVSTAPTEQCCNFTVFEK